MKRKNETRREKLIRLKKSVELFPFLPIRLIRYKKNYKLNKDQKKQPKIYEKLSFNFNVFYLTLSMVKRFIIIGSSLPFGLWIIMLRVVAFIKYLYFCIVDFIVALKGALVRFWWFFFNYVVFPFQVLINNILLKWVFARGEIYDSAFADDMFMIKTTRFSALEFENFFKQLDFLPEDVREEDLTYLADRVLTVDRYIYVEERLVELFSNNYNIDNEKDNNENVDAKNDDKEDEEKDKASDLIINVNLDKDPEYDFLSEEHEFRKFVDRFAEYFDVDAEQIANMFEASIYNSAEDDIDYEFSPVDQPLKVFPYFYFMVEKIRYIRELNFVRVGSFYGKLLQNNLINNAGWRVFVLFISLCKFRLLRFFLKRQW